MKPMKRILLFVFATLFSCCCLKAQENEAKFGYTISFEPGLLMGNPQANYPAPFSTHISFMVNNQTKTLLFGLGSGAEIIGKTFVPIYADLRLVPFKHKPVFFYGKTGFSLCSNNLDSDQKGQNGQYYYTYLPMPHYPYQNVHTKGGLLAEAGIGILIPRNDWKIGLSLGVRHQQTEDIVKQSASNSKTFENRFNRIAFRLGFWF